MYRSKVKGASRLVLKHKKSRKPYPLDLGCILLAPTNRVKRINFTVAKIVE